MADEAEVMEKMFVGQDLDPIERRKAWFLCRAALRGFEAQIYQYQVGLLDELEWQYLKRIILETASAPGFDAMWPELSVTASDALRTLIEDERKSRNK